MQSATINFDITPTQMINRRRDGQLYITGIYDENGPTSCFGVSLDKYGEVLNEMYMNSAAGEDSECHDLVYTEDDEVLFVGFRTDAIVGLAQNVGLLVLTDDELTEINTRVWGTTNAGSDNRFFGVDATADGSGFFVVGYTDFYTLGVDDNILIKLDRDLNHRWIRSWGEDTFNSQAYKVKVSRSHDQIYVMGLSHMTNVNTVNRPYILRLDKWGETIIDSFEFTGQDAADVFEIEELLITEEDDEQNASTLYVCGTVFDAGKTDTNIFWAEFADDLTLTRMISYGVEDANESSLGGCAIDIDGTHLVVTFASDHSMDRADFIDNSVAVRVFDGT